MIRTLKTRECVENVKEFREKDLYEEGKCKEKYGERHKSNLNIIQSVKLIFRQIYKYILGWFNDIHNIKLPQCYFNRCKYQQWLIL